MSERPYKDRKYDVVPYDPAWPALFEEYAARLKRIFRDVRMEHVGSTSIPGMPAKPCIDILIVVDDLDSVDSLVETMIADGFEYAGAFVTEDSRLFRMMKENEVLANIHVFPAGHPHVTEMLQTRDYLRTHPEEVNAYAALKQKLASKYPDDYAAYRKYKDPYIEELKKRVRSFYAQ